jgi:hypothetical protein
MRRANGLGGSIHGARTRREVALASKGRGASFLGLALICLLALSLPLAPAAGAATVTQRPLLFTVSGANVPDYPMEGGEKVAVDNATGALYLGEGNGVGGKGRVFRYHADGTPWPFSSTGLPYLSLPYVRVAVAVDNSGGPNQSHIYVVGGFDQKLRAFDPSGELLWAAAIPNPPGDVAVDPTGHPYVAPRGGYSTMVRKYDNTGSPPALIQSTPMDGARAVDVNAAGEVFLGIPGLKPVVQKWVGGSFSSTLDPKANDVYVDQSDPAGPIFTSFEGSDERQLLVVDATAGQFRLTFGGAQTTDLPFDAGEAQVTAALRALPTIGEGNVNAGFTPEPPNAKQIEFRAGFLARTDVEQVSCQNGTTPLSGGSGCSVSMVQEGASGDVQEYAADGTLLGSFGEGALGGALSVAYNPGLDRLYAIDGSESAGVPSVLAFGPVTTGTVGDATIDSPSAIGAATAHFSGTVNPQGTTSQWSFQWRKRGQSWATAASSPPQSLPADSSDHVVEYTTTALRGGTQYQVRLVAVNTANQLVGASEPKLFTTAKAPQAPAVTIGTPTAITNSGATIGGTVNPQGDTADWRVQTSADPACASDFTDRPLQQLSSSSSSPVNVSYVVTGLLPSQRYCARIFATNSAGSTTSTVEEFETLDAEPTQVFAAYAAPRTDTTARLNAYVNPEGSAATYRFEYSLDGSTWTTLPDMQTREERRQIVVASELSGLQPATTYHYRFVVENDAGDVQSDEKTFETRSIAEMQLPQRGIELVSKPEKGNQNISVARPSGNPSMVSSDGNRAVWLVLAGAPGGTTGSWVNFLSTRTPNGWESKALAPPAGEQIGGGERAYKLNSIAPDFRTFLMRAVQTGAQADGPPTFVRLDDEQHQEVLKEFTNEFHGESFENADMSPDGAHVISRNPETKQLEELGSLPHEVVSIMPDGQPADCGVAAGNFYGTSTTRDPAVSQWQVNYERMSTADASRIYFQTFANGGSCTESSAHHAGIYYRDRVAGETFEIDSNDDAPRAPELIRSTPDGRSVFFVTETRHSPADENFTGDVYRWNADDNSYACITCVVDDPGLVSDAELFRRVLVSDDFSHVYFTSSRQLLPGRGVPGVESIYSLSNGELRFVASTTWHTLEDTELSSDGDVLLFRSTHAANSQLTADEQASQCRQFLFEGTVPGCQALFRYEDSANSLECLSCLPGGVTSHDVGEMFNSAALSEDGSTVAFVTHERLLPEDINNTYDIYEWHNGALQLISDGETVYPSTGFASTPQVYGMDSDGGNIFFTIIDPDLTGYEQDSLANLYDSRVGGGFPRPTETPHCSEESCQGPLVAPPPERGVGSSGLAGAGNEVNPDKKKGRCAGKRGKAKSRCLKAKKRKRHKQQSAKRTNAQSSDRGAK